MRARMKQLRLVGVISVIVLFAALISKFWVVKPDSIFRRILVTSPRLKVAKIHTFGLSGLTESGDGVEAEFNGQKILKEDSGSLSIFLSLDEDLPDETCKVRLKADVRLMRDDCEVVAEITQWDTVHSLAIDPISNRNSQFKGPSSHDDAYVDLECTVKPIRSEIWPQMFLQGLNTGDKVFFKSVEITLE